MALGRENLYVTVFMEKRLLDFDTAYQQLTQDCVNASLNIQGLSTTGLNMDYIFGRIKESVAILKTPQYIGPGSTVVTPLPPVLQELFPRVQHQKETEFYLNMKKTANFNHAVHSENQIPDSDVETMRTILKDLHSGLSASKRQNIFQYYLIGKVLLTIKNKCIGKTFSTYIKQDIGFSQSHSYFLIDFALLCMTYPKLKQIAVPIGKLKTYFSHIKTLIINDANYWI